MKNIMNFTDLRTNPSFNTVLVFNMSGYYTRKIKVLTKLAHEEDQ